ncbi:hypothetical protein [Alicycliphilus denitrificans]|uniref:hypothetical protein n=1 Tax=Alicycliphilus denitrificans TaxID=179636 RepID=UPI0001D9FE82|nr:hypothetical protein [Alicycliphilus denitrificans]ADU99456.1 hypothetical protein Alide_1701 [Alicycliphilus denitrificans BC]
MAQRFLARISGKTKQMEAKAASAGAGDAGKIPALGPDGKLDMSMMPAGIGADTQIIPASEALSAGNFVNIWSDAGAAKVRLADNSNGRPADGYVLDAVSSAADATVYPLDGTNSELTGLAPGAEYWLGTAGGVTNTPLDETDAGNANKISQYLGKAKSATELITVDDGYVVL